MSTKKLNMKTALVVLTLAFGLGGGSLVTAQAKSVVLKEFPKNFRGSWGNSESTPFSISKTGISRDDSCIQILKLTTDTENPNILTVTSRNTGMDCDDKKAPVSKSVYLLKNGTLTETIGKKTWGPFHRVK